MKFELHFPKVLNVHPILLGGGIPGRVSTNEGKFLTLRTESINLMWDMHKKYCL